MSKLPSSVPLVPITAVPPQYQPLFPYSTFNPIQSASFNRIMKTDTNVMLCAPTGCGKTVVAELAMIHAMMKSTEPTLMLYVSPLRALCQEKVKTWADRLGACGVQVQEYTGDSNNQLPSQIKIHTLLCTTPEKFDLTTRSWKRKTDIFNRISLVIIDEVHTLGDNRGSVLEAMITRLMCISDNNHANFGTEPIRIIALSATVPNYKDIAKWIRAENPEETNFGEAFRSTQIQTHVFGYKTAQNDWQFESSLTNRVAAVIKQFAQGKPALVFCCTRKSCEKTAARIAQDIPSLPKVAATQCHDKNLASLLQSGVGIHTAGLASDDRLLVEELFIRGDIQVICATSTLSQGINLPAALVVIKGTKHYTDGFLHDYEAAQLLQMMGRAGRPQFHDKGVCIIMTEMNRVKDFESIVNNSRPVESTLLNNLMEHVNAEIALGTIKSLSDALKWLKTTFLYIRLPQNPLYYHVRNLLAVEEFLSSHLKETIDKLNEWKFISIVNDVIIIQPTGALCSKYGICVGTMKKFSEAAEPQTLEDMLKLLSKADEFSEIIVRQEDKQKMRVMAADPSNYFTPKACDDPSFFSSETKVFLLIQSALGNGKIDDWTLSQEFTKIKRTSDRLLSAMFNLFIEQNSYKAAKSAITLKKCIENQMWETERARIAQQVKGIGEVYARKLSAAGYDTFDALRKAQCHQLERITGHRPGWGISIVDNIARVPNYEIVMQSEGKLIKIYLTNNSHQDPPIGHRGAELLVAVKDKLVAHYHIRTIGHLTSTFQIDIKDNNPSDFEASLIDTLFIGVDIVSHVGETKMKPQITLPQTVIAGQKRVMSIPEQEEIIVWEMKPTITQETKQVIDAVESEAHVEQEVRNKSLKEAPANIDNFLDSLVFDDSD